VLAAAVVLAGCGGGHTARVPPGAIALVGDRPVPRAALDVELRRSRRAYAAQGKAFPARGTAAFSHVQSLAVRLVVDHVTLAVQAASRGVVITPAQVDRRLRQLKRDAFGGSESRYRAALRRQGMTAAEARSSVRDLLLAEALRSAGGTAPEPPEIVYADGFAPANSG